MNTVSDCDSKLMADNYCKNGHFITKQRRESLYVHRIKNSSKIIIAAMQSDSTLHCIVIRNDVPLVAFPLRRSESLKTPANGILDD
jgi:hypothetical protein